MGRNLHFAATILLGLALWFPCSAQPEPDAAGQSSATTVAGSVEAVLEAQTLDRAGEVNAGDTPQVPHDLKTRFQPYFNDTLWLRAGGFVQLQAMGDVGATGKPFVLTPSQLGVPGAGGSDTSGFIPLGSDARLNLRRTRLFLDAYSEVPQFLNGVRGYAEIDYSGKNGTVNVRHLYIALPYLVLGRTNSAFKDPSAEPECVDSGGPNAKMGLRQQGIRWVIPLGDDKFSLGLEDPGPGVAPDGSDLTDDGLARKLDVAAHYRSNADWGHIQVSAIHRDLSLIHYNPSTSAVNKFTGWGLGVSGQVFMDGKDNLQFEFSGGPGIGRYINDLAGTGSELGITSTGQVGVQFAWGGFVAYQHWLDDETRFNAYLSTTQVHLLAGQPPDSFQGGYKLSANVMRDITESLRLGLEYEHGFRVSHDGTTASGGRVEFMVRYGF